MQEQRGQFEHFRPVQSGLEHQIDHVVETICFEWIQVHLGQFFRALHSDLFDIDPSLGGDHQQGRGGVRIESDPGIIFLGNLYPLFD